MCSKLSSPQFGAVFIQSARIEIWVKEELAGAGRGTVYWDHITKHLHINPQVMANIMGYARESVNKIAGDKDMTFDTFSLILTKSTKDQYPHLDLRKPLVQYGMIFYLIMSPVHFVTTKIWHHFWRSESYFPNFSNYSKFDGIAIDAFNNKLIYGVTILRSERWFLGEILRWWLNSLFELCLCDRYKTHCLKHASAGTLTVIEGGKVQKGSWVTDGSVQCVFFFTGSPSTKVSYNLDVQRNIQPLPSSVRYVLRYGHFKYTCVPPSLKYYWYSCNSTILLIEKQSKCFSIFPLEI